MIIQESANERTKLLPSVHEVTNRPPSRATSIRDGDEQYRAQAAVEEALPPPPYSQKAENVREGATRRFLRAFCIAAAVTLILGAAAALSSVALRKATPDSPPSIPGTDEGQRGGPHRGGPHGPDRHDPHGPDRHDPNDPWENDPHRPGGPGGHHGGDWDGRGGPDHPHGPPDRGPGPYFPGPKWPDGPEGEEASCRSLGTSWKSFSYDLPLESVLFFMSEGLATTGRFNVVMRDASEDQTRARLTVHSSQSRVDSSSKHTKDDDDAIRICMRRRSLYFTGWGIKIYSEADKPRTVDLTLHLPMNSTGLASLQLETQLPYFTHSITGLDSSRPLRTLKLLSKMADITIDDVHAEIVDVRTSGAEIGGSFTAGYVKLETTSSPISANITLLPQPFEEQISKLIISNHDAPISTSIVLGQQDDPESKSIPRYQVSLVDMGYGKLGRMDVQLRSQRPTISSSSPPPLRPYTLDFTASSNTSPITVGVDPWFEGHFGIQADTKAEVDREDQHAHDPAGMGRYRNVELTRSESYSVEGTVAWQSVSALESDADVGVGRVQVHTSAETARLLL